MNKIIDQLASDVGVSNKLLLEKDLHLHKLLIAISNNKYLQENLVFKGGTCIIKCYLGYYRFSEDLDFTWINQKEFEKKSQKEIRKIISQKTNSILRIINDIAKNLNMDFKSNKNDRKYIEFGGSNKFLTIKMWYESEAIKTLQFIKIQINFFEKIYYPFKILKAKSIVQNINIKEFKFLFPEYAYLLELPKIKCYDIKEILAEKVRAILTRRGFKARDFIDVYIITTKQKIKPAALKEQIIGKIKFMMRYDKYVQNINDFRFDKFVLGEEEKILLKPLDKGFEAFLKENSSFLLELIESIK
ncbi:MAG: nucleotidyl transferase AbiEii/AbiGii toxin family protein [Nanoarchaeota archaeon]|nr:nucleotidyl transferase AbiEii/AbiGii toxin family protein [Nanoarchaeota archaeon]MBU1320749.1 nucleotidyl transferase AbiEii/AbiGii toxin family protein [Nanoarchaeota archaeon]MBU1597808.1 nucleotidyl transferase AbiEii/AbiGii toxin family protein [Nanoarchaeota archaeon]MBU2441496.1 nucleotidyl transferase AbiEii/AbiGii toxin family protein [Nanoarchaeota archaeon]